MPRRQEPRQQEPRRRELRTLRVALGLGLLRGLLCGAAVGALTGAALVVAPALQPVEPGVWRDPFSLFLTGYAAVVGALVGGVVGLVVAAPPLGVVAVGAAVFHRRGWGVALLASAAAAVTGPVALAVLARHADGVYPSSRVSTSCAVVSAALALWQVRRVTGSLHPEVPAHHR